MTVPDVLQAIYPHGVLLTVGDNITACSQVFRMHTYPEIAISPKCICYLRGTRRGFQWQKSRKGLPLQDTAGWEKNIFA